MTGDEPLLQASLCALCCMSQGLCVLHVDAPVKVSIIGHSLPGRSSFPPIQVGRPSRPACTYLLL